MGGHHPITKYVKKISQLEILNYWEDMGPPHLRGYQHENNGKVFIIIIFDELLIWGGMGVMEHFKVSGSTSRDGSYPIRYCMVLSILSLLILTQWN